MHSLIFKNTTYQTLTRLITSGIGFLITIIIASGFGALGFGEFTKVTTFVGLFYLIADFGFNAIFLQKEKINFKDLFYLRLVIAFILVFIANVIAFILPFNKEMDLGFSEAVRVGILIFSLSIVNQSVLFSSSAIFQKKLKYEFLLIASFVGSFLTLVLIYFAVSKFLPLNYIYLSFVIGGFATGIISIFKAEKIFPISFNKVFAKELFLESLPIGLMLVFNLIYFRIDTLLLSFLRTTSEVGIYGFSYKFFDFLIAIPLFLSNAIYPALIKEKNNQNFYRIVNLYVVFSLAISFFVILIFWYLSPFIGLVKSDFLTSVLPFKILLLSLPVFFMTSILQWSLIAKKQQKYLMAVYIISAIINIILNLIFIPSFGYIASAIITGITEIIVFIFLSIKIYQTKKNYD